MDIREFERKTAAYYRAGIDYDKAVKAFYAEVMANRTLIGSLSWIQSEVNAMDSQEAVIDEALTESRRQFRFNKVDSARDSIDEALMASDAIHRHVQDIERNFVRKFAHIGDLRNLFSAVEHAWGEVRDVVLTISQELGSKGVAMSASPGKTRKLGVQQMIRLHREWQKVQTEAADLRRYFKTGSLGKLPFGMQHLFDPAAGDLWDDADEAIARSENLWDREMFGFPQFNVPEDEVDNIRAGYTAAGFDTGHGIKAAKHRLAQVDEDKYSAADRRQMQQVLDDIERAIENFKRAVVGELGRP